MQFVIKLLNLLILGGKDLALSKYGCRALLEICIRSIQLNYMWWGERDQMDLSGICIYRFSSRIKSGGNRDL